MKQHRHGSMLFWILQRDFLVPFLLFLTFSFLD